MRNSFIYLQTARARRCQTDLEHTLTVVSSCTVIFEKSRWRYHLYVGGCWDSQDKDWYFGIKAQYYTEPYDLLVWSFYCLILHKLVCVSCELRNWFCFAEALKRVFTDLRFVVQVENDLTRDEVVHCMKVASCHNHQQYSCFVCCILSHGAIGAIYGADGRTVPIKDLTGLFKASSCPSLGGKPKVFFIQACQGTEKQISYPCTCSYLCSVCITWIIRRYCSLRSKYC